MNLDEFTKYFLKNKHTMLCPICNYVVEYKKSIRQEYCCCDNIEHNNLITRNNIYYYDFYCGIEFKFKNCMFIITFDDNLYIYSSNNKLTIRQCKGNILNTININLKFSLETPYIDLDKIKSLLLFI